MNAPTLASTLPRYRYVYATVTEDAIGAYRGDRDAAMRDARRLCRKSATAVLFYEDGRQTGWLTPVAGRAQWTASEDQPRSVA